MEIFGGIVGGWRRVVSASGLCLVVGLLDKGWVGMRAKKRFVYLKWASHFWLSIQNVIFFLAERFGWFWVGGWFGLGGWVHQITPPPPV